MSRISKEELQQEEINRYLRPRLRGPKTMIVETDGKIYAYEARRSLFGDGHQVYRRLLIGRSVFGDRRRILRRLGRVKDEEMNNE